MEPYRLALRLTFTKDSSSDTCNFPSRCVEELALQLKPSVSSALSRPMQRKLVTLINCQVQSSALSNLLMAPLKYLDVIKIYIVSQPCFKPMPTFPVAGTRRSGSWSSCRPKSWRAKCDGADLAASESSATLRQPLGGSSSQRLPVPRSCHARGSPETCPSRS